MLNLNDATSAQLLSLLGADPCRLRPAQGFNPTRWCFTHESDAMPIGSSCDRVVDALADLREGKGIRLALDQLQERPVDS